MSTARPGGSNDTNTESVKVESRSRSVEGSDVAKLKSKMRDVNLRLSSLQVTNKPFSTDLPSPFSGNCPVKSSKAPSRSPGSGYPLKLDTTPQSLNENPINDYVSSKQLSASSNAPPSGAVSPLSSPLNSATYGPRSGLTPAGGQAAEMQARILALQRSRSKRTNSASSPQLNALPRRSSSSSSAATLSHKSGSRTSISTLDSFSNESEDDELSSGSPAPDKFDNGFDMRPLPTSSESPPLGPALSRVVSPNSTITPTSGTPKQPLASNGFDPNTVISPTAASFAANGGPVSLSRTSSFRTRQRSSLSARRGMKLDASALQSDNRSSNGGAPTAGAQGSAGSVGSIRRGNGVPFGSIRPENKAASRGSASTPQETSNWGLFRDYRKYVDIETGTLNFAGKACVHAQGIEFSSGEKFNISIDKLEFISELGSGNYGTVQKVLHTPNGVVMAVKEIRLELDEASLRQIIMELDVLHRCEMENIIAFYGAFFVEGSVYICMEYMDGGSINKIYENGIEEKYLKYIVRGAVAGLKQLKEQFNIIHRDVKPTNILCSTTGDVKLCDFGVSGNLVASIARTNIGCQAYMAPERIKVDRVEMGNQPMTYTAESDIWSLGLSIIEMAKGSYPYPSESFASIFSQLNAIVEDPAPAMDPTKYSPEACDFVNQLLCKSPEQRPKYADIVKHPWLANVDCTSEEMGAFVARKIAEQRNNKGAQQTETEQPTITLGSQ